MKVISKNNGLAGLLNMAIAELIEEAKRDGKNLSDIPLPPRIHWITKDRPLDVNKVHSPSVDVVFVPDAERINIK